MIFQEEAWVWEGACDWWDDGEHTYQGNLRCCSRHWSFDSNEFKQLCVLDTLCVKLLVLCSRLVWHSVCFIQDICTNKLYFVLMDVDASFTIYLSLCDYSLKLPNKASQHEILLYSFGVAIYNKKQTKWRFNIDT